MGHALDTFLAEYLYMWEDPSFRYILPRVSLHVGHALDTYTFYADKPKTFFCDPIEFLSSVFLRIHGVDQLCGFFADPWKSNSFVVFLRIHGSLSVGGIFAILVFCGICAYY